MKEKAKLAWYCFFGGKLVSITSMITLLRDIINKVMSSLLKAGTQENIYILVNFCGTNKVSKSHLTCVDRMARG